MKQRTQNGLSGTALKTIALVLMLLDHIHYFFEFTGLVPVWFSMLGRLAAPLFLFCTVEGFAHTHNRKRYILRIWLLGAAMGTVEFFMMYAGALRRGDGFYPQNAIFLALFWLCLVWQGIDWLRQKRWLPGLAAVLAPIVWPFIVAGLLTAFPQITQTPASASWFAYLISAVLPMWSAITDGGWCFLLGGILLYALYNHKTLRLLAWAGMSFLGEFLLTYLQVRRLPDFTFAQMFTV